MGKSKIFWGIVVSITSAACLLICVAYLVISGKGNLAFNRISSGIVVGIGQQAPEFELPTLSGDVAHLSQYRGQPMLIYFGTSW